MIEKTMRKELLSRMECSALRGIAIAGIFLHNYCHWVGQIVQENEYTFDMDNCNHFFSVIKHPDALFPAHLLSFFGHYGVPVFLFLSAYGLVMKYEKQPYDKSVTLPVSDFIRHHYMKLFKMMIIGFVAFTVIDAITPGRHHYSFIDIVAQLGMFNNVLPNPDNIIWPGPYWFFGLMLQLYVVYRLLLYRRKWVVVVACIALCWLLQIFCDPEGETLNRLRYNFIGGMLPFGAGLLYARYGRETSVVSYGTITLISAALILLFSFNYQLWFFIPLLICTFSIGLIKTISRFDKLMNMLNWLGVISAALFVCHPITRKIFIPISRQADFYAGLLLYIVSSLALAWLFNEIMKKIK